MHALKSLCMSLLAWSGVPRIFALAHRRSLTILLYHGVAPRSESSIYNYRGKFIPPDVFDAQMRYLAKYHTVLPLDEATGRLQAGTLPLYAAAITFDDGYHNNYEHAFPILRTQGLPATFFLTTDFVFHGTPLWVDRLEYALGLADESRATRIDRDIALRAELKTMDAHDRERCLRTIESETGASFPDFDGRRAVYAPLTSHEITEMHTKGMSFGAHTRSHPILSRCTTREAGDEITGSRDAIAALVPVSDVFAYPNGNSGDWSHETEMILARENFKGALSTVEGLNTRRTHPFRLRRITMDATDVSSFIVALSGIRSFLRSFRATSHQPFA